MSTSSHHRNGVGLAVAAVWVLPCLAAAGLVQQVPDREFRPAVEAPAYPAGAGPTVCVDEAHRNFHTIDNRFWAFAELLRRDGHVVRAAAGPIDDASLAGCRVLVSANAAQTFGPAEITAVERWVASGGSLLLIADHRPYGGAAAPVAAAFGVEFTDGYAVDGFSTDTRRVLRPGPTLFRTEDGTLRSHPVVTGRTAAESVSVVRTFTGQAFRGSPALEPLLVFREGFVLLPDRPAEIAPGAAGRDVGGWLQGGLMRHGAGRAAFFGEAAMFSAQRSGPSAQPMGMNAPGAEENSQFVLNLLHWLTGLLGPARGNLPQGSAPN